MIPLVFAIATGPLLILAWSLVYSGQCVVLIVPLIFTLVVALAARDSMRYRRQCLADGYFVHGSLLHRLFRSTTLISLVSLVSSTLLTTVLLVTVPRWSFEFLILLTLDALFIAILYHVVLHAANGVFSVNRNYRQIFARNWAVAINMPIIVLALLLLQLRQPPPDYIDPTQDIGTTMRAASASLTSNCAVVDLLTRASQEGEAAAWWLMVKSGGKIDNSHLRWVAWLFFLLSGTLGLLAYSRFCAQLVYYADAASSAE